MGVKNFGILIENLRRNGCKVEELTIWEIRKYILINKKISSIML